MIKILAGILMLIDHIGLLFFPQMELPRLIGRLSMPMYAYCVAKGIMHTRNVNRYFARVLAIACISQVIYGVTVGSFAELNICFTWAGAILFAWNIKRDTSRTNKIIWGGAIVLIILLLPFEYGIYGLAYSLWYLWINTRKETNMMTVYVSWGILHLVYIVFHGGSGAVQLFTLPSVALIDMLKAYDNSFMEIQKKNMVKYFYPLHLLILFAVKIAFSIG